MPQYVSVNVCFNVHIYHFNKDSVGGDLGGGVAPSLHPASYAYAYDQCTNRSRWAHEHSGVRGLPSKLHSNFDKKTSQKERCGSSGSGYGLAHAPPAVHFAVLRYPQRQLLQHDIQKAAHTQTAPLVHNTVPHTDYRGGRRNCLLANNFSLAPSRVVRIRVRPVY